MHAESDLRAAERAAVLLPGHDRHRRGQYTCSQDANNAWLCSQNGTLGGTCTNEGQGTAGCNSGAAQNIYCNGNSGQCTCSSSSPTVPFPDHICGGYGSQCEGNTQCASGYTCVNAHFCAATCSPTNPCGGSLTCLGGVCRQSCEQKNDCTSRAATAPAATAPEVLALTQRYLAARRPFDLEGLILVALAASAFFIVSW